MNEIHTWFVEEDPSKEFWLGLDLDGVCNNITEFMANLLEVENGMPAGTYTGPEDWYFSDWGIGEANVGPFIEKVAREGGFLHAQPFEFCSDALKALKRDYLNFKIRVITSRQFKDPALQRNVVWDTAEWLHKHEIPYDELCFTADKAGVHADLYIDDSPENLAQLIDAGKSVLVYDHPYNKHVRQTRVSDWAEILQVVGGHIEEFNENNIPHGVG